MDNRRFDRLARRVSGAPSRRRVLQLLLASTIAPAVGNLGAQKDAEAGKRTDPRCQGRPFDTATTCPSITNPIITQCVSGQCFCAQTVGRPTQVVCVRLSETAGRCPFTNECDRNRDCGSGEACIPAEPCCGAPGNLCAPKC